jgi:hypothetical protein
MHCRKAHEVAAEHFDAIRVLRPFVEVAVS